MKKIIIFFALLVFPFLLFPVKSTNYSYGIISGYGCFCMGIERSVVDNYHQIDLCYGIPYKCGDKDLYFDSLKELKLIDYSIALKFFPALIFLVVCLIQDLIRRAKKNNP